MSRLRRCGVAVVAAAALSLLGGLAPASVGPASAQTAPSIELVAQSPYVRRGGTFSITVRVTGARIPQTRADLRQPDKPAEMLARDVVARFPETGTRGPTGLVTVDVPLTGPPNGAFLEPGVWPVAIGFGPASDPNRPKTAIMSQMVVLPDAAPTTPPIAVTIAVPLTAKPALRPDQQVRLDQLDRSRLVTLVAQIESLPSAVLAASPQLLRALELSADPQDSALLDRLRSLALTHEVIALPYSNIDAEAWRQAGLLDEVRAQYEAGRSTIQQILGVEPARGTSIVDASATPDTLAMLADLGTKVFIFDESHLDPLPPGYSTPPTKLFDVKGSNAVGLSVDPELRRLFAGDSVLNANRLIADLSALYFDVANAKGTAREERHGVVVLVPDTWSASPQFMNVITSAMSSNPLLRATTFSNIFQLSSSGTENDTSVATPAQGILTRGLRPDPPKSLGQYGIALRQAQGRLDSVARLLVANTDNEIAPLRELLLVSGDDRLDPSERTAYLDQANAFVDRALKGVSFTGPHRLTLTAEKDTFPVIIQNDAGNPSLRVRIEIRSDPRLDFPGGPFYEAELPPGQAKRLDLPVRSRSPGSTTVDVVVTSPDGSLRLAAQQYTIRSLALSGVGLGISIAALLVLLTWWIRNHRATRRAKAAGLRPTGTA